MRDFPFSFEGVLNNGAILSVTGLTTSEAVGTGWSGERPTYSVMRIKVGISYLYFRKVKGKFATKSARHGVGMGGDKPIRTPIGLGFSPAQ